MCAFGLDALRATLADRRVDRACGAYRPTAPTALEEGVPSGMAVTDRGLGGVVLGHDPDGIERRALIATCPQIVENTLQVGR